LLLTAMWIVFGPTPKGAWSTSQQRRTTGGGQSSWRGEGPRAPTTPSSGVVFRGCLCVLVGLLVG
jgi:hypothetical protein